MKTYLIITVLAGMFVIPAFGQEPDKGIGIPPGLGAQPSYPPEHPAVDKHWELAWGDDFNFYNDTIWSSPACFIRNSDDIHFYTNRPENMNIKNGNLVLWAKKGNYTCNGKTLPYTGGYLDTNDNFCSKYGYIEAQIKLPYMYGVKSAFWTYRHHNNPDDNANEIDIFEMLGHDPSTIMGTNLHMYYCPKGCGPECKNVPLNAQCCPGCDTRVNNHQMDVIMPDYANTYRTYAIEWTPTKFIWYVDGVSMRNFPNPGIHGLVKIILQLGFLKDNPPSSTFTDQEMLVDYVRVYKLICGNEVINSSSYNFDSYDNTKLKKSITIGGNGASNTIANGKNVVMRATDFIEIKGEFTASLGASLYLDVNACNNNP